MNLRALLPADQGLLEEMLYLALWQPPGAPPLPREIVHRPELSRYVAAWGALDGDCGWVAEEPGAGPVGALWLRRIPPPGGYGFWDSGTPELSMAVVPGRRGQGIGTVLLVAALASSRSRFPGVCLSVAPANPAQRLYRRFGFAERELRGDSLAMVLPFR